MYYAPQEWLADWSKLTGVLTKKGCVNQVDETVNSTATYDMHYYDRPFYDYPDDGSDLPEGLSWRECIDCSKRFVGKGSMKLCRQCRRRRILNGMKHTSSPHDVRASDVPDVPSENWTSESDKVKKTAPIETCLVKKKEDTMDTTREEMLKTFPSGSNRLENPEAFMETKKQDLNELRDSMRHLSDGTVTIQKDPESEPPADSYEKIHDAMLQDLQNAFRKDKRGVLLSLYSTICDISRAADIPTSDMLDRLTRIDAALS